MSVNASHFFIPLYDERLSLRRGYLKWAQSADSLIFDLEDSLSRDKKEFGRNLLLKHWNEFSTLKKQSYVRLNSEIELLKEDLRCINQLPGAIPLLSKIRNQGDVENFLELNPRNKEVAVLIETPQAIANVESILSDDNLKTVFFGPEDLSLALGIEPSHTGLLYAASRTINAAAIHNKPVIGCTGPFRFIDPQGLEVYKRNVKISREIGFKGSFAIHYAQIPLINEVYHTEAADISRLEKIFEQSNTSESIFNFQNEIIGPPMFKRYKSILHKIKNRKS